MTVGPKSNARIACSKEVKRRIGAKRRGGEGYDDVLRKMLEQYDPDEAGVGK